MSEITETITYCVHEDEVKSFLVDFFKKNGWEILNVKYGHEKGVDFEAQKGNLRWKIEVKSEYKKTQANRNSFLGVWGEILTRIDDDKIYYGIAFPDTQRYRELYAQITPKARKRVKIFVLFCKIEKHALKNINIFSWSENENKDIEVPPPFETKDVKP